MPDWGLWIILAVALGVGEVLTLTLVAGLVAVAALVAAIVAAVGLGIVWQVISFGLASALMLFIVRPIAKRHTRSGPTLRTNIDRLIGAEGTVTEQVSADGGRVKISGDIWTARSFDDSMQIPVGTRVEVYSIEGATAVVYPRELPH